MQAAVATQAVPVGEPWAVVVGARNSVAELDRLPAAAPEATTVAAQEPAYCLAMKLATAGGLEQVPAAEQEAETPEEAKLAAAVEEGVWALANPAKRGSTAFCER